MQDRKVGSYVESDARRRCIMPAAPSRVSRPARNARAHARTPQTYPCRICRYMCVTCNQPLRKSTLHCEALAYWNGWLYWMVGLEGEEMRFFLVCLYDPFR